MSKCLFRSAIKIGFWGAGLLLFAHSALAGVSPKERLKAMCDTMSNSSYHGVFVHISGDQVESMEIFKRKDDRGDIERMISLNGEAREVIRDNQTLKCIMPKNKMVLLDDARLGSEMPISLPQDIDNVERYYTLKLVGEERIAGHPCDNILLAPKDSYRYGHKLCIAKENNLLVKSVLLDAMGVPLERMMFTQLDVSKNLPDSAFASQYERKEYKVNQVRHRAANSKKSSAGMLQWRVNSLPKGFYIVSHNRQYQAGKLDQQGRPAFKEHIVLSDGMATVSVFVETWGDKEKTLVGASKMGAVNAFGRVLSGNKVIAVGEVPLATVKLLANGVSADD